MNGDAVNPFLCAFGILVGPSFIAVSGFASPASPTSLPLKTLPREAAARFDSTRKTVTRIEGRNLLDELPDEAKRARSDPSAAAIAFVSTYRQTFRLIDPVTELRVLAVKPDELGFQHVRLAQVFRGLEVAGGEMLFHFNRDAALYLVTGSYIPTPALSELKPKLDKAAAVRAVAAELSAKGGNWPASLKIWPSPGGAGLLAYEVAASVALDKAWRVFVDARSGKILDRISTVYTASTIVPRPSPKPKTP